MIGPESVLKSRLKGMRVLTSDGWFRGSSVSSIARRPRHDIQFEKSLETKSYIQWYIVSAILTFSIFLLLFF